MTRCALLLLLGGSSCAARAFTCSGSSWFPNCKSCIPGPYSTSINNFHIENLGTRAQLGNVSLAYRVGEIKGGGSLVPIDPNATVHTAFEATDDDDMVDPGWTGNDTHFRCATRLAPAPACLPPSY